MNRLLANLLGLLNGFVALIVILIGLITGMQISKETGLVLWVPAGAAIGLLFAAILCGAIAVMIDMRNILREMRDALEKEGFQSRPTRSDRPTERTEPKMN